ncbi:hypothetical protein ACFC3F_07215 [Microbacterium sp. NPDC055910]|uniref:hypothetical protein n=1 Tax=Microbacterium sp. NPDC055910 TaxID=3345659 RepID=UPI0035D8D9AD
MAPESHTPSLGHLRDFARARANGRATHVESDRRQVEAPADDRVFAFVYERLITRIIEYVRAGNRGGALDQAVFDASDRMKPSYAAAAKGMAQVLQGLNPTSASRRQRNIVVLDTDGYPLVSLRVHLVLEAASGNFGAVVHFSGNPITQPEMDLMETAVAKAVQQIDPNLQPMIVLARTGVARPIDPAVALTRERISFLRTESLAYREAWAVAA